MSLFGRTEIEQLKEENQQLREENRRLKEYVSHKEKELEQETQRLAFKEDTIRYDDERRQQQFNREKKIQQETYRQQQRENRGAINQKKRYLQKQQQISQFLKQAGWTINEKPLTFEYLTQLAKEWEQKAKQP